MINTVIWHLFTETIFGSNFVQVMIVQRVEELSKRITETITPSLEGGKKQFGENVLIWLEFWKCSPIKEVRRYSQIINFIQRFHALYKYFMHAALKQKQVLFYVNLPFSLSYRIPFHISSIHWPRHSHFGIGFHSDIRRDGIQSSGRVIIPENLIEWLFTLCVTTWQWRYF